MEERKNNAADDAKIVCLQEGRTYNSLDCLAKEISAQLSLVPCGEKIVKEITADYEKCGFVGFVRGLKESLQKHHLISGEEDEADDDLENSFKVKYIGLYVYTDAKGHELVIYFAPKFVHAEKGIDAENVDAESVKNRRAQLLDRYDRVLLAIDRYQKDQARIDASWNENADSRVGLLPLVVMLIRDYLEHGLYTVHYNELEKLIGSEQLAGSSRSFKVGAPCTWIIGRNKRFQTRTITLRSCMHVYSAYGARNLRSGDLRMY